MVDINHKIEIDAITAKANKAIDDFVNRIAKLNPTIKVNAKVTQIAVGGKNSVQAQIDAQKLADTAALNGLKTKVAAHRIAEAEFLNNIKTQTATQLNSQKLLNQTKLNNIKAQTTEQSSANSLAKQHLQIKNQEVLLAQRQLRLQQQQNNLNKPKGRVGVNSSGNLFGSLAGGITGTQLGVVGLGAAFIHASDAATNLATQIRYISRSEEESILIRERLYAITQKTYTNINDVANSLQKNFMSLRERGFSDAVALDFQEAFELIKSQSGANRAEIGGASLQFSQALSADFQGTVGQELNSIIEQLPAVGRIIVNKYNEIAGTNFGLTAIKELARTRKLDSNIVVEAITGSLEELKQKQSEKLITYSDVFTHFKNKLTQLTGTFNEATGFSDTLSRTLITLIDNFKTLGVIAGGFALNSIVKFAGGLTLVKNASTGLSLLPALLGGVFSKTAGGAGLVKTALQADGLKSKLVALSTVSFVGLTTSLKGLGSAALIGGGGFTKIAILAATALAAISTQVNITNSLADEGITIWDGMGRMFSNVAADMTEGLDNIAKLFGYTKEEGGDFFRSLINIGIGATDKLIAAFDWLFSKISIGFAKVSNEITTTILGGEAALNALSFGAFGRDKNTLAQEKLTADAQYQIDSFYYGKRVSDSENVLGGKAKGVLGLAYEKAQGELRKEKLLNNLRGGRKGQADLLKTDLPKDKLTKGEKGGGEQTRSDILAGALQSLNNEIVLLKEHDETKRDVLKTVLDVEKQLADSENVPANMKKLSNMEKEQFLQIANIKKKLEFADATRQYVKELKNEGEQLSFISSVGGAKNAEAELAVLKFEQEQKMKINNADERNRIIMEQKFLIGQRKNVQMIDTLKNEERSYEFELAKLQLSGIGNEGKLKALETEYNLETKIQDINQRNLLISQTQLLEDEKRRVSMINNLLNPAKEYEKTLIAINQNAQQYPTVYNNQRVEYEKANAEINKLSGEITTESGFERGFATIKKSILDTSGTAEQFITNFSDGFATAIVDVTTGASDAVDVVKNLGVSTIKEFQKLATQEFMSSLFYGGGQKGGILGTVGGLLGGGGSSGGGGFLSSIGSLFSGGGSASSGGDALASLSLGSLAGFATGGSFTVGGNQSSGDKNLVAFRANSGEKVTVAPSKNVEKGVSSNNENVSSTQPVTVNVYLDGKQILQHLDLEKSVVNAVQKNRKRLGIG